MRNFAACLWMIALLAGAARAEESPFAGHWDGSIELPGTKLDIHVHLSRGADGAWSGTIDIPMQGARGLPLSGIVAEGDSIVFVLAGVPGNPTFTGTLDGDRIAGPFTQSGQAFPFELARGTGESRRRAQDPVPPFPYSSEDVTFASGDVTLAGTLVVPEGEGPFPGVVLLTGSGGQNRDEEIFDHRPFLVIADHLARAGVATLRFDDRGIGGSTGSITESTTADFARDALAAVALLRARARVAPDRVGLLGHSEGAMSAPLAASESRDVAFLVLLAAPAVPTTDLMALQTERLMRANGADEETVRKHVEINRLLTAAATRGAGADETRAELRGLILRQVELAPEASRPTGEALEQIVTAGVDQLMTPWFQYFLRYDPREALGKVTVPVLALYGALDLQVVDTQNLPAVEAALAQAGNRAVTTRSMPGLNHLFQHATKGTVDEYGEIDETISPEVLEIIRAWIVERFGKRG